MTELQIRIEENVTELLDLMRYESEADQLNTASTVAELTRLQGLLEVRPPMRIGAQPQLLGGAAWQQRKQQTQTTFLERTAPRED